MANLSIRHHERVEGHPHRWHVFFHGRDEPLQVELPPEEREKLDLSDEEIHTLVPEALERHHEEAGGDQYANHDWDAPVRVMQMHFVV
jgi:hypothetical protein